MINQLKIHPRQSYDEVIKILIDKKDDPEDACAECGHSIYSHKYLNRNTQPCQAKHCDCRKFVMRGLENDE